MKQPAYIFFFCVVLTWCSPSTLRAQEVPWSFSVSGGWVRMNMDQVDEDSKRDVDGWRYLGIPIEDLPSLKSALLLNAKATYRFERDFVFSVSVTHAEREVNATYKSYDVTLSLTRSVGFTDALIGLEYYFPLFPLNSELYLGSELGMMCARANAQAFSIQQKTEDSTQTEVVLDTDGIYKKNKLVLNAVAGANIRVFDPLFIRLEGKYKLGTIGRMEGDVRRFDVTTKEESTVEFNFSGLFLSVGIGIVF